ncbi:hypothetical protein NW762_007682 [Fusarium torreyae]|uniref:Uncharacterized protein n=1 Tax=Fusarium torreyae TaxID=1237075 RepID=A0A9W8RXH8_9HYPO|nr:hypothetical protein NW762_007682 [Fusarium torreyae]
MADSSTPARASATGETFQPASTIPSTALVRNAKQNRPPYPSVQNTENSTYEPKPTISGQYYERHTAGPGVEQILGVRVEVDGDLMSSIHNLTVLPGAYEYKDCTKVGPGTQVSGVDMKVFGKADGVVYPTMNYRSIGTHAEEAGVDNQGQETKTYQISGGRLRVVHKNQDK